MILVNSAFAKPLLFDVPAQPLSSALLAFSQQSAADVLFSHDEVRAITSTAMIGSAEPEDALNRLLRDTGFLARRDVRGKFIVTRNTHPTGNIRGTLQSTDGTPLPGLHVSLARTRTHTYTDTQGAYSFDNIPAGTYRLVFSGPGHRTAVLSEIALAANQTLQLGPQTIESSDELVQLDTYRVEGTHRRANRLDRSASAPWVAAGNIDLPRTENDALPYRIFDRTQITRSGVVNLNEFLQREVLDGNTSARPPDQNGSEQSYVTGSSNLNLRGFDDSTVILVNGRRLPEVLTTYVGIQQADVNLIPLGLVQQVEVLSVSGSAIYSGNPVGGVINIVLRKDIDATEVTTTYSNALDGFDASQFSVSLQHGQTLLDGRLRLRLSAATTRTNPPVESELNYRHSRRDPTFALDAPVYRATPNVRSANDLPLFAGNSATVTSVTPGADGNGGLAAFAGREGRRNFDLFDGPTGMAASINSMDYPYGRTQDRQAYFGSATYDLFPWLQIGLDGFHARTSVTRGLDVLAADLLLPTTSPFNPFGQDVMVSLNEIAPHLGHTYSEARLESSSVVLGLVMKLPRQWRATIDTQYGRNTTRYRGLAGADMDRWQQLVDAGLYNPLRDTQIFAAPDIFYEQALIYHGEPHQFVTLGDYETLDFAFRATNQQFELPTGTGAINAGVDYRRNELAPFTQRYRFADGSLAEEPRRWTGRRLERVSVFGELQAPVIPQRKLPHWIDTMELTLATRYVIADTSNETNLAPAVGVKIDLAGGLSFRGSVTLSSRFPTPNLSREGSGSGGPGGGINLTVIDDPRRNFERYEVNATEPANTGLSTEDAVTQTAGVIFQRGKTHRFRASLDFTDTRKTNEIVPVTPQLLVNLESLFPKRITRNPPSPGDPNAVGRITSIFTGNINAAERHSQSWSSSVDYSWIGFLGGTLELRGRHFYFQTYRMKLFSNSPAVDQLNDPDGAAPGLLRHRLNLSAGWFNTYYGFGLDAHYTHSRLLPLAERPSQGDKQIKPYAQLDAFVQCDLSQWLPKRTPFDLRGQIRVNNLLDANYPRYVNEPFGAGVQPYGDFRGRTLSVSLTAKF